jgi:PAS domain S-box-containing protein
VAKGLQYSNDAASALSRIAQTASGVSARLSYNPQSANVIRPLTTDSWQSLAVTWSGKGRHVYCLALLLLALLAIAYCLYPDTKGLMPAANLQESSVPSRNTNQSPQPSLESSLESGLSSDSASADAQQAHSVGTLGEFLRAPPADTPPAVLEALTLIAGDPADPLPPRLYFETVEQAPVAISITDAKANILYANAAFEKLTGYTRADVLGKNEAILSSNATPDSIYQQLWRTIRRKRPWTGTWSTSARTEATIWRNW